MSGGGHAWEPGVRSHGGWLFLATPSCCPEDFLRAPSLWPRETFNSPRLAIAREQALASRFNTARKVPRRGAGSFSAHEHDLGERISRPGAASDSGRIGHSLGRLMRFAT